MKTTLRNASLTDLAELLQHQHAAKVDAVVPGRLLTSAFGRLVVPGMFPVIDGEGVGTTSAYLTPTEVCDETLSDRLGIPSRYLKAIRGDDRLVVPHVHHVDQPGDVLLLDAVLNAHFARLPRDRRFLVRSFVNEDGESGIARAILSDVYRMVDNLDCLMAVLDGAKHADTEVQVQKVDLTERTMRLHFIAPQITALAPKLLTHYRPPTTTQPFGTDNGRPIVFAGIVASNSETGGGAFTIAPRFVVQICSNGLTRTQDAMRSVHLGGRLEEGVVRWSADTQSANIDLIRSQATDAVRTFLDTDYMERALAEIEDQADTAITDPEKAIQRVSSALRYTKAEQATLLAHFIGGGQSTAGGVLNAVTSMAQTIEDADRGAEIEAHALDALALAAR